MAAIRFTNPAPQFLDSNGDPLNGGSLTFYESGGSAPTDTYSDEALTTPNTNPITLDSAGRAPVEVFLDSTVDYRVVLKDSGGSTIADKDPVGGNDIDDAVTAHNNSLTAHYAATESQRGFVELSTDAEAQAQSSTSVVLTPANLGAVTATETRDGIIEIATTAEAQAGTDDARALTPAKLQDVTATETRAGVVELATTAEATAGTDTARAVTPAGVAAAIAGTSTQGTFTPTITNTTNIAASTAYQCHYTRNGDVVSVWGQVGIDGNGTSGAAEFGISLPVSSTLSNDYELSGVGSRAPATGGDAIESWYVQADTANNRAKASGSLSGGALERIVTFNFAYLVI